MTENGQDYYKILQCDRTASIDVIKRNYQRLILSLHPDKSKTDSEDIFHLIQKAWSELRDPERRKQYDATLTCQEHSEVLLYDTIKLADMTYYSEENIYTYSCRCGGTYVLEGLNETAVIGCDACSFSIQVDK